MNDSPVDVAYIARLARITLTEEETNNFSRTVGNILEHVAQLQTYNVEGVEPTFHAVPVFDRTREDIVRPGLTTEEALLNAPAQNLDQIRVPKVVESA